MILNSPYISGSITVTNLSGSGVRYLMTSASGLIVSQTPDAAIKTTYTASATAGQTVFPVTNGYSTGLVDVYLNGTKLSTSDYSDADGLNITLVTGSDAGDLLEFVKYSPALGVTNNALRQLTTFTSSEGQTVYSASYTPGLLDVYYNGSRLTPAEYTANNGTYITLATGSAAGDVIDMLAYSYQVGAFTGIGGGGVTNQIAFYNTTSSISGSSNFTVNSSTLAITGSLSISGSVTPFTVNNSTLYVSSSNVGIGTINPFPGISYAQGLHVSASGNNTFVRVSSGAYTGIDLIQLTDGNASLYLRDNGYIQIGTNNTERMRITATGNVGIGTSSPGANLEISGSGDSRIYLSSTTGNGSYLRLINNGVQKWFIGTNATGAPDNDLAIYGYSGQNGNVVIYTNGSERMRITTAGAVAIGDTPNDSYKIYVKGDTTDSTKYAMVLRNSNPSNLMFVRNDGNINMGLAAVSPYNYSTTGRSLVSNSAGDIGYVSSTRESKKNIESITDISWINQLRPVSFNFRIKDSLLNEFTEETYDDKSFGLIADEVEQINSDFVFYDINEDGTKKLAGVKYESMTAVLIKALQEANAKITILEEKLERNNIQ